MKTLLLGRLPLVLLAVAALATTALLVQNAFAQSTNPSYTLVDNFSNSTIRPHTEADYLIGDVTEVYLNQHQTQTAKDARVATSFKTGNNPNGYNINSISAQFSGIETVSSLPKLSIHLDVDGKPSELILGELARSGGAHTFSILGDTVEFTATEGSIYVAPHTRYWIVVRETNDHPWLDYSFALFTYDHAQDDSYWVRLGDGLREKSSEWTIGNHSLRRETPLNSTTAGEWTHISGASLRFGVKASLVETSPTIVVDGSAVHVGNQNVIHAVEDQGTTYTIKADSPLNISIESSTMSAGAGALGISSESIILSRPPTSSTGPYTGTVTITPPRNDMSKIPSIYKITHTSGDETASGPAIMWAIADKAKGTITFRFRQPSHGDPNTMFQPEGDYPDPSLGPPSDGFDVFLDERPHNNVTITAVIEPSDGALSFAASGGMTTYSEVITTSEYEYDWSAGNQFSAAEDSNSVPENYTVTLSAEEENGAYYDLPKFHTFYVHVNDNDAFTFSGLDVNGDSADEGQAKTFSLKLQSAPSSNVTVTVDTQNIDQFTSYGQLLHSELSLDIDTDADKSGNQNTLEFTTENWNSAQSVTVTPSQDSNARDELGYLSFNLDGGDWDDDTLYVPLAVADDDDERLTIVPPSGTTNETVDITEGNQVKFTLALASMPVPTPSSPLGNGNTVVVKVSVSVPPNKDGGVWDTSDAAKVKTSAQGEASDEISLTFSQSNFNTPQSFWVTTEGDTDFGSTHGLKLYLKASGGDYDTFSNTDYTINVNDPDVAELRFSQTEISAVENINPVDETFTVKLSTEPQSDVTLTFAQPTNAYVDFDADAGTEALDTSLTFTPDNWNTPQTVDIKVYPDHDGDDATATVTFTASGATGFDGLTQVVTVNIDDEFECPPTRTR